MPWKTMDVREQRVSFVVTARRGEKPFSALCEEFGISRPTGYLWLARFQQARSGGHCRAQPAAGRSPGQTAPGLEAAGGGTATALSGLGGAQAAGAVAPTRDRVAAQHDSSHSAAPRSGAGWGSSPVRLPSGSSAARPTSCGRWTSRAHCGEATSWVRCRCWTTTAAIWWLCGKSGEHARRAGARATGEAFRDCGVPEAMLMDHGTPWWGQLAPRGLTRLGLWLMKQGIELHWSGIGIRRPRARWSASTASCSAPSIVAGSQRGGGAELAGQFRWEHNQRASARGAGHGDAGQPLAAERATLPAQSAGVGVSGRFAGAQGGLRRQGQARSASTG